MANWITYISKHKICSMFTWLKIFSHFSDSIFGLSLQVWFSGHCIQFEFSEGAKNRVLHNRWWLGVTNYQFWSMDEGANSSWQQLTRTKQKRNHIIYEKLFNSWWRFYNENLPFFYYAERKKNRKRQQKPKLIYLIWGAHCIPRSRFVCVPFYPPTWSTLMSS